MAGSFSGHLIDSHNAFNQLQAPFGGQHQSHSNSISTHGPMSFNPHMHGSFQAQNQPTNFFGDSQPSFQDISDATTIKIHTLQAKLNQKLGPEYISQRPGPGGGKLTYAEGWKIINLANEVFGFNGWSSSVINLTTDFIDYSEESKKFTVGVAAIVRVTLRDGTFHEDIGYGMLENSKSKGAALDKVSCSHICLLLNTHIGHKTHNLCREYGSVKKKLSQTRWSAPYATSEMSLETVFMISHIPKKSSRSKYSPPSSIRASCIVGPSLMNQSQNWPPPQRRPPP